MPTKSDDPYNPPLGGVIRSGVYPVPNQVPLGEGHVGAPPPYSTVFVQVTDEK